MRGTVLSSHFLASVGLLMAFDSNGVDLVGCGPSGRCLVILTLRSLTLAWPNLP